MLLLIHAVINLYIFQKFNLYRNHQNIWLANETKQYIIFDLMLFAYSL